MKRDDPSHALLEAACASASASLARFDYMAQLDRYRDGMKMKVLSRCLSGLGAAAVQQLHEQLGRLRVRLLQREHAAEEPT